MSIADLKSAFTMKGMPREALCQESVSGGDTEPEVNPEEGEILDVELIGSGLPVSAVLTFEEFRSTEDGFRFRGMLDSIQSDDEFRDVMAGLLVGEFGIGFELNGYVYTGSCSAEDFTVDENDVFEVSAVVHTDGTYKKEPLPVFDIDRYIQDTTQDDSDDADIWDILGGEVSGSKNILNRK